MAAPFGIAWAQDPALPPAGRDVSLPAPRDTVPEEPGDAAPPGGDPALTPAGQDAVPPAIPDAFAPRAATGGAQTLEDILRRQEGLKVDDSVRRSNIGSGATGAPSDAQLGTLGGASDPDLWRALRYGEANVTTSSRVPAADVIVQDGGMRWLAFRDGPLREYGGYLLAGMLVLLAVFYLVRGRIRLDGTPSGRTVARFNAIERFGHWLLAGSFILLAITGLLQLFGRVALIPYVGKEAFSTYAILGKWVHNNVAWAFILGLIWVTVLWIAHNIPNRTDLVWMARGGGLFTRHSHPPARKFNAGQKIIFWAVLLLGASISVSGLSLLFPFDLPLFSKTFGAINAMGIPGWFGYPDLPTQLQPQEEMQLAQLWHAIVGFVMIAIVLAHIYIGTIGMEGAFDAMGRGEVDVEWAKEHHSLWYEEVAGQVSERPHAAE